jgi:hypothetical protein
MKIRLKLLGPIRPNAMLCPPSLETYPNPVTPTGSINLEQNPQRQPQKSNPPPSNRNPLRRSTRRRARTRLQPRQRLRRLTTGATIALLISALVMTLQTAGRAG